MRVGKIVTVSLRRIVVVIIPLALFGCLSPINDIVTDSADPLPLNVKGEEVPYPDGFAATQKKAYPSVEPLRVQIAPDTLFQVIVSLVDSETSWRSVVVHPEQRRLTAVAVTPLLRFRDDVVIEVREGDTVEHSIVHMRSRSRLGKSDLGTNAKRISTFFDALEQHVSHTEK
ncbi:MAG: DUF1499 domain-containing protein [Bdellovibrionota bacterium]|jgi:uncharacterized protein (DUF1499 family)